MLLRETAMPRHARLKKLQLDPKLSAYIAMPQYCHGLQDPAGGAARVCIFASCGDGGRAEVQKKRDGRSCAFCCPEAWARAWGSPFGKNNIVKRLAGWLEASSPTYEAAFSMGCPGLFLSEDEQARLRSRLGQAPKLPLRISWAHRKPSRLQDLRYGRPIPPMPSLTPEAYRFMAGECNCYLGQRKSNGPWAKLIRTEVRCIYRLRQREHQPEWPKPSRLERRKWWRARRVLRARMQPSMNHAKPPYNVALLWALQEGIVVSRANV